MASRYESVATILSRPSSKVTSTPVRMARLSSFDTTRATRRTMDENCENGISMRCMTSTWGNPGKSSWLRALMEKDDASQVMSAASSSASTCTAASGRFLTISENSLPGTTALPSSSTSAATEYWMESSKSVVWSVSRSPCVSSKMPERMGSVERVDTPLSTTMSAFWSSDWLMLNFKAGPFFAVPLMPASRVVQVGLPVRRRGGVSHGFGDRCGQFAMRTAYAKPLYKL